MDVFVTVLICIAAFFVLTIVLGSYFTVQQQSRAIIERFGKYVRTANPGLNFKIPYIESIIQRVSLRVQQLLVEVDTKTLDNVFVKISVAVQYRVVEGSEADSLLQAAGPCAADQLLCARRGTRQGSQK